MKCKCGGMVIVSKVLHLPDWGFCPDCTAEYNQEELEKLEQD